MSIKHTTQARDLLMRIFGCNAFYSIVNGHFTEEKSVIEWGIRTINGYMKIKTVVTNNKTVLTMEDKDFKCPHCGKIL